MARISRARENGDFLQIEINLAFHYFFSLMQESEPTPLDLICNCRVLVFLIGTGLVREGRTIFLYYQGLWWFNLSNKCDHFGIPSLLSGAHQLYILKVRKRVVRANSYVRKAKTLSFPSSPVTLE